MKLPIPADWDGESWCRWAICWPDSEDWEAILRGFVTLPQRGWTWDERTGSILAVQATGQEIAAVNLPFSGVLMACNDTELTQAFSDIALAIRYLADKQCCDNLQIDVQGGFQGTITQGSGEVVPIYGSEPPIGLGPGEIPATYEDPAEYDADKCRLANQIIDGLSGSLTNLAALGTYNAATLAVLIGVSIATGIVFPPAMIPTAISVLIILSGSLVLIAQLNADIIADRADWVCWLYEGENTEAVLSNIADALDILLAAIPVSGVLAWALKSLVLVLMNSNTLNQLFSGGPVAAGGETDCSACTACPTVSTWNDTSGSNFSTYDELPKVLTSHYNPSGLYHYIFGHLNVQSAAVFTDLTGWTDATNVGNDFRLGSETEQTVLTNDVFISNSVPVGQTDPFGNFAFHSATEFSIVINCVEELEA